jgi:transposase-like protein
MGQTSFPQADSIHRVIAVAENARSGATIGALAERFGITQRQARYYADAAAYLGLVTREGTSVSTTPSGRKVISLKATASRMRAIAGILEQRPVFGRAIRAVRSGKAPTRPQLNAWVRQHTGLSPVTAERRAITVANWAGAVA